MNGDQVEELKEKHEVESIEEQEKFCQSVKDEISNILKGQKKNKAPEENLITNVTKFAGKNVGQGKDARKLGRVTHISER